MSIPLAHYNFLAEQWGNKPHYRAAVVSVHGANTRGAWQKWISPSLQDHHIRYVAVDYGTKWVGLLWPRVHEAIAHSLVDAYMTQTQYHNRVSFLAHSLGTLGVGVMFDMFPDVMLDRVVFCGSILRCGFPWTQLSADGRVDRVLNETAANDLWVKYGSRYVPGAGPSGVKGFVDGAPVVINRAHGHTRHSGLLHQLHLEKSWIPFLLGGEPTQPARGVR